MKWNISNERGSEIIHTKIIDILRSKSGQTLLLQDLITHLNIQTTHILFHKLQKYNSCSKYIKGTFGGITHLLDKQTLYEITTNQKQQLWVTLLETKDNYEYIEQKTLLGMDWVFV